MKEIKKETGGPSPKGGLSLREFWAELQRNGVPPVVASAPPTAEAAGAAAPPPPEGTLSGRAAPAAPTAFAAPAAPGSWSSSGCAGYGLGLIEPRPAEARPSDAAVVEERIDDPDERLARIMRELCEKDAHRRQTAD